jgi:hypothetical protein
MEGSEVMEDYSGVSIEDMCPILDSGRNVSVQFITDKLFQMTFTYDKWRQYVALVNRRNSEIRPMISAIGTIAEVPNRKGWLHENCKSG